jgi:hypothetical protein
MVERHARSPLVFMGQFHKVAVSMRSSLAGARVEMISERFFWVTFATFRLGGRMSLTASSAAMYVCLASGLVNCRSGSKKPLVIVGES